MSTCPCIWLIAHSDYREDAKGFAHPGLTLDIIDLYTKFEDLSFRCFRDMFVAQKCQLDHTTLSPDHVRFRGGLSSIG